MNFPIVIANWKMNLTPSESETVAKKIAAGLPLGKVPAEIVLCPSFSSLERMSRVISQDNISLGCQNIFWKENGPFTGEVSVRMIKELGCGWVIIGHSERRIHLKETNDEINKKIKLAINYGLVPILCVGEKFEERQMGQKEVVLMEEITLALKGIDKFSRIVIAYEPVWVIGRGEAINPEEARDAVAVITYVLRDMYPQKVIKDKIKIIYGGSVDDHNVNQFVDNEAINGVLVGGASLKPDVFLGIINNLISHAS